MDSGLESRIKKSHKKLTNYDLTKKTEKGLLTLRKNQIDDYIMSKRKIILNENLGYQINPLNLVIGDEYVMDIEMFLKNFDLNYLCNYIFSNDTNVIKYGIFILRKYLSQENFNKISLQFPLLDEEKNASFVDQLCNFLSYPDNTLQYESSWILINLISLREETEKYLSTEANLSKILNFFNDSDEVLTDNAIWLISNLISSGVFARLFFYKTDICDKVTSILEDFSSSDNLKEKCVWMLCNLLKGTYFPPTFIDLIQPLIKYFSSCTNDKELRETLFCLYKLSNTSNLLHIEIFINSNLFEKLTTLYFEKEEAIKLYIIKITANLTCGNDVQTQRLINKGIIPFYKQLIDEDSVKILKEVLWGLSNICAGTISQIEEVRKNSLLNKVIELNEILKERYHESDIIKEAWRESLFVLGNAITGGLDNLKIELLVNTKCNLIYNLYTALGVFPNDAKLIKIILNTFKAYILLEEEEDPHFSYSIKSLMQNYDMENLLNKMLSYPNNEINESAQGLLDIL